MDHQRSSYQPRHRQADRSDPASPRSADGRMPRRGGFRPRGVLALAVLSLLALGACVPFGWGRAGADLLQTASESLATSRTRQAPLTGVAGTRTATASANPTSANPTSAGVASRSTRRMSLQSSSGRAATRTASAAASPSALPRATSLPKSLAKAGPLAELIKVVALVNDARATAKCSPLHSDPRLDFAAFAHSEDMIIRNYFAHLTPDGLSASDRAKAAGYPASTGENIALGQPDAASVMNMWMTNEVYRAKILNCASQAIGMGLAIDSSGTPYWTQMFGAQ